MGIIGVNGSGKSSLFSLILQDLESDAGDLQLNARDVIAHVAQQSPSSNQPALEFVLDGDHGLRDLQREIAVLEAEEAHNDKLHGLYEQMDNIDGYTAETRGARLLHTAWVLRQPKYKNPSTSFQADGGCALTWHRH